ncbi:DEAD/DEAH box helicase [Amantichitinum ursilacus]|uniref:Ski2-like helicase n=1 Tax=Amantichitinum ursilacus TaxID=857265 RepID=A0A0N0GLT0_9NEIS|nr:DEAD/DEAH box helicase [Amantichitinum ursilacus]KPC50194.1 ski2-like helicase [Amantichitinum ursilacus]
MKHSQASQDLYGITRSTGKKQELGIQDPEKLKAPAETKPEELFILTIGTLGDCANWICNNLEQGKGLEEKNLSELQFSARFFDAYLASNYNPLISHEVSLLASAAYYLASRPGSSLVLARRLSGHVFDSPLENFLLWILTSNWASVSNYLEGEYSEYLKEISLCVAKHFFFGENSSDALEALHELKSYIYQFGSAKEIFLIDVCLAITYMRLQYSSWNNLEDFTDLAIDAWRPIIGESGFPTELWPSQMMLGQAGIFRGSSGIVQMPTSAGKTRSIEIIIRSALLANRTKLVVVVAPFKALCHEITHSLRTAFLRDQISVNDVNDVFQMDYMEDISDWLQDESVEVEGIANSNILVLTPEKFLYILRQSPKIVDSVGLVIYDEGHQFDTGKRGVTYELLLTEISSILPISAQTVLISAVIENAEDILNWLIGEGGKIVRGNGLLPTSRSIAFARWAEEAGELLFYEGDRFSSPDYSLEQIIEPHRLTRGKGEKKDRQFPEKATPIDIGLFLGIRLVGHGAVAIFCGRPETAEKILNRAVEVYSRGLTLDAPASASDSSEISRLCHLISGHFGEGSDIYKAARLGFFSHHGNTPQGIRLSVEHAMQRGYIQYVVCTSTLAQGVNLPIRYLIVSGLYQAGEKIKPRDFQNLMGRAGRAGMHTEGLVIFSDPDVHESRYEKYQRWRFLTALELLNSDSKDTTGSSILSIVQPLKIRGGLLIPINPVELIDVILYERNRWREWVDQLISRLPIKNKNFNTKNLLGILSHRRNLISALESYMMANRGDGSFEEFQGDIAELAARSLAYSIASEEERVGIVGLFFAVAKYIENKEPDTGRQRLFSKTLMPIVDILQVEAWLNSNWDILLNCHDSATFLECLWPIFVSFGNNKLISNSNSGPFFFDVAKMWVSGEPYKKIFQLAKNVRPTKPWGEHGTRQVTEHDIIEFCEGTLGFDCPLVLAAVTELLFGENSSDLETAKPILFFHKALKYGLPDPLSISCFERGFSDRVLAQDLTMALRENGYALDFLISPLGKYEELITQLLSKYPRYFQNLLLAMNS